VWSKDRFFFPSPVIPGAMVHFNRDALKRSSKVMHHTQVLARSVLPLGMMIHHFCKLL
jgi:hypothetical protein